MRTRRRRTELTPFQTQRLNGWLGLLDDPAMIDTAQSVLRLPPTSWPVPPCALAPVLDTYSGAVLAPAVEGPTPEEAAAPIAPVPSTALRGAYARRAAARA